MTHPSGLGEYTDEELYAELASRDGSDIISRTPFVGDKNMQVGNRHFIDHVKVAIKNECNYRKIPMLNDIQIGVVITSLRNHSYSMLMTRYDRSKLGDPTKVSDFYPVESSVGRFLRDAGNELIDRYEAAKRRDATASFVGDINVTRTVGDVLRLVDVSKTPDNPEGNPFIPGNLSVAEALAIIKQLVLDEVIGENMPAILAAGGNNTGVRIHNSIKSVQRKALEKVMGGK